MRGRVALRKSTRNWLGVFAASALGAAILERVTQDAGCLVTLLQALAVCALLVLCVRGAVALFRLVVRRTALRLAFSYFLIGVVPIPLLAALLFLASYILAHQYMANRLRRELTAVGESAVARRADLPSVSARAGRVEVSDVPWLKPGDPAPWLEALARPGFLVAGSHLWLATPSSRRSQARLLDLTEPGSPWLQDLADRTGYEVGAEIGEAREDQGGIQIGTKTPPPASLKTDEPPARRPQGASPPGTGLWKGEWIHAFYLETPLNRPEAREGSDTDVAMLKATASPRLLAEQLFAQGVAEVNRIFWIGLVAVGGILLIVYLVALTIAFVLIGSIARNVNRLTRATQAIGRGDFSVRIQSKSRDQIGDLARSFDGMAESIQKLLAETAEKERLKSELAIARTIQHKLLPPPEAALPGFTVHAHFEPVAEIGGDYYDYIPMPDGRTAVALGDVSGHGLPTGLLVAMVKAALSTLLEAGHQGAELFGRLNELIHRSTEPRHYMTLALLAYDPRTRKGLLANAGQLAPYRISSGRVEALSLPGLPLGLLPDRTFPAREFAFASGDVVVFLTDGLVEAVDENDEPFGFDRLEALLAARAAEGAAALRDALLSAVRTHSGPRVADDDRTLLILVLE
jgi:serine phosphatase RsbU (regulator of sigma subunit)